MNRLLFGALALACVTALGACNTSDLSALQGAVASGTLTPTLAPGTLTDDALAAAGLTATQRTTIKTNIAKVRSAANKACSVKPFVESVANTFIAGPTTQGVEAWADILCRSLATAPTYAALGSRKGEVVKGHVLMNGFDVTVYGVRTR